VRECNTHHHACDCREEKFAKLEQKNARLRGIIEFLFKGLDEEWEWIEREAIASIRAELKED